MIEFIALTALMFGILAFSIDSMLPAMGVIAAELSPDAPNQAQFILTSFIFGMGVGTLFSGPLADAVGRKTVILGGLAIYAAASLMAWYATSIELMLIARFIQGIGGAGPRVAAMAMVRDLYSGRQMARVLSLAMAVFVFIPAVAPLMGSWITAWASWRAIFLFFIAFACIVCFWLGGRQPETLPVADRRAFKLSAIIQGTKEVLSNAQVNLTIVTLALSFAIIFLSLATSQQVFDLTFDRAESFPKWFALMSVLSASGGVINAWITVRYGMQKVIFAALLIQSILSVFMAFVALSTGLSEQIYFAIYFFWLFCCFMCAGGFAIGNLNALALEPLGHIAGLASSVVSAIATILAVILTAVSGALFTGTPVVPALSIAIFTGIGALLMSRVRYQ